MISSPKITITLKSGRVIDIPADTIRVPSGHENPEKHARDLALQLAQSTVAPEDGEVITIQG